MAATYKILGQGVPGLGANLNLYTVPTGKSAVVSTITVTNIAASAATFSIYVCPFNTAVDPAIDAKHSIAYSATVAANDTTAFTIGVTLAAGDFIVVASGTSTVAFSAFGSEIN